MCRLKQKRLTLKPAKRRQQKLLVHLNISGGEYQRVYNSDVQTWVKAVTRKRICLKARLIRKDGAHCFKGVFYQLCIMKML